MIQIVEEIFYNCMLFVMYNSLSIRQYVLCSLEFEFMVLSLYM